MRPLLLLGFAAISGASLVFAAEPEIARLLREADEMVSTQRHTEARAAYAKILSQAPENPEANCALGLYACDDGAWESALAHASKAVAQDPNNARYQYCWAAANGISALKAGLFSKLGYAKKCLAGYERAAALEPTNPKYHFALLNYYQQAPGIAGGSTAKAYAQAEEIRKLDTQLGREAVAQLYWGEKKYDLIFRECDEALREKSDNLWALRTFAQTALASGQRLDDGVTALRRWLELKPIGEKNTARRAEAHCLLARLYERKGQRDESAREFSEALREDPNCAEAKRALGQGK